MKNKLNLKKSFKLFEEAFTLVPGGVLGVRRPYNFIEGEYPIFFESAKGCKVIDVDGNEYIDMMAAYGPIILGHREEELDNVVINHIKEKGNCMTLTLSIQNKLTKKLQEIIPSAEKSIIVKTGSDATTLAVRIARSYTKRSLILRCGYHGWHDWCVENITGIPKNYYKDVIEFKFNNLENLKALLKKNSGKVAAIILWPIHTPWGEPIEMPSKDYLKEVRNLADKNGCLLIFDEIRSGFRIGLGGVQAKLNIIPDLTVVGKAMANGYPISAVVGKRRIMNEVTLKVLVSSTYFPNSLEQIAALKNIEILQNKNVINDIYKKGEYFCKQIKNLLKNFKFSTNFTGEPLMPYIVFNEKDENLNKKIKNYFYTSLVRSKIFLAPNHHGYIMYRHTFKDLDLVLGKIEEAFNDVKLNV